MEIWEKFDKKINTKELKDGIKQARENDGGNYEEVPYGTYEVNVEKIELRESKKGDPMVSIWFNIIAGNFKNSKIFYNQVINQFSCSVRSYAHTPAHALAGGATILY